MITLLRITFVYCLIGTVLFYTQFASTKERQQYWLDNATEYEKSHLFKAIARYVLVWPYLVWISWINK